jgi:hypothetical protein
MNKRLQLIELFERNMTLVFSFRNDYKAYLDKTNHWNEAAFADAKITHKQYYDELVRISDIEYSVPQHNAIKTIEIQESFLDGYIVGVNQQYDNLLMIYEELKRKSNITDICS